MLCYVMYNKWTFILVSLVARWKSVEPLRNETYFCFSFMKHTVQYLKEKLKQHIKYYLNIIFTYMYKKETEKLFCKCLFIVVFS